MSGLLSKNQWVAIYSSQELEPKGVKAMSVLGTDIAVWREEEGRVHAWHNQCPHRGMRLSYGFVRGSRLACLYHGWQYEGTIGKCAYIPAHPDLKPPKTACTKVYPCFESQGLVWVSIANPTADEPELSALSELEQPLQFCRTVFINEPPDVVSDILKTTVFLPFDASRASEGPYLIVTDKIESNGTGVTAQVNWHSKSNGKKIATVTYQTLIREQGVIINKSRGEQGEQGCLIFAILPINENKTGVHVLFSGDFTSQSLLGAKQYYAQWATRLRWSLENKNIRTDSYRPWF